MQEVKIYIPDNCELIKSGNSYVIKEKKKSVPKSWEDFCIQYPIRKGEAYITTDSNIIDFSDDYPSPRKTRISCVSSKEAEAFVALMQLRQLRKAWNGDWKETSACSKIIRKPVQNTLSVITSDNNSGCMTFPTESMANSFLDCFRDLIETAKILL